MQVTLNDDICKQLLLFIGLWYGYFIQVNPVGLRIAGCIAKEQVIRAIGARLPVAVLIYPCRITLPGINN